MWLYLHQEGKIGNLIDLTGSVIWTKTSDLQVFVRRPHDAYTVKFENESDTRRFFKALLAGIKDKAELLDMVEADLKYATYSRTEHAVRITGPDGHQWLSVHVEN
ncbi:MAG TPA: hypothetical protein VGB77_03770 [Abditibacteriaceae bacterium]|jgi:hypothetical protein